MKSDKLRSTDKDIFLAKWLKDANFDTGFYQVPEISPANVERPADLVLWSQRKKCRNKQNCGLTFYEFDAKFDSPRGLYNILKYGSESKIKSLVAELKEFAFVICPDYSVYGNFPNYKQIEAMAKSREVGYVLSSLGVIVIINYRATYKWTYELALSGMSKHQIVAIGTLGALRDSESRKLLKDSIGALVDYIEPKAIIVYGQAPADVFESASNRGIEIWQYESAISRAFKGGS